MQFSRGLQPWLGAFAIISVTGCHLATSMLSRGGHGDSPTPEAKASPDTASAAGTTARAAATRRLPDDGVPDGVHHDFVGQIVFASQQIDREHGDAATFVSEFYADDLIYGRAYLPHSIENADVLAPGSGDNTVANSSGNFTVRVSADGRSLDDLLDAGTVSFERRKYTTLSIWPRPTPSDGKTSSTWVKLVRSLSVGRHEVTIEVWPGTPTSTSRKPLAAGTIIVHKTGDERVGFGRTAADLKAGMTDAAAERELLGVISAYAAKEKWKETTPSLTIADPAWEPIRQKGSRMVIARRIAAWVHLAGPGDECGAQRIVFQHPVGKHGERGAVNVAAVQDRIELDCTAVAPPRDRWSGRPRQRPTPTGQHVAASASPAAPKSSASTAAPTNASPAAPTTNASAPSAAPTKASAPRVAAAEPVAAAASPGTEVYSKAPASDANKPGRISLGVGMAINATSPDGVASYANLGVHLGRRVELGVGATWPFNALGYLRVSVIAGRFELSPMLSVTALAESGMSTSVAMSGGLSLAYAVFDGSLRAGVRLDALVTYNPEPARLAVPVLASTYVRF